MKQVIIAVLVVITLPLSAFSQTKTIAMTIDDLPFVGSANYNPAKLKRKENRFMLILNTLKEYNVPATGFIIAGSIEKGQWQLLEAFRDAGLSLGNHTYSHKSLNSMSAEKYINDIRRSDEKLASILTTPKMFRYPYLAEGSGKKRQQVHNYLFANNYTIAPVTIDSKDFRFNSQLYAIPYRKRPERLPYMKKRYLDYVWKQTLRAENESANQGMPDKTQILLIHANLLNSHFLADVIELYQKHGYKFVSLEEALRNNANLRAQKKSHSTIVNNEHDL